MSVLAKPCSSSSEACGRRCRKATSLARRRALDAAIAEIEERYGSAGPGSASRFADAAPTPPASQRGKPAPRRRAESRLRASRPPPAPTFSTVQRPSAPAAPGPAAPSARSPSQTGAPSQPGAAADARSGRGAATSAADAREDPAGREPAASANPGCREASRSGADRWLRRLDPSWLLQWPTSLPPDRRPAGPLRRWGRRTARMKVCPDWRRSTRPRRSDRTRPTTGTRSTRRPLSRAVTMNLGNGPKRPKWRRSSTAPAWRPDRRRRCSARLRRAPKSPSRSRLLWIAAAVVLGIVLAVAGAAILMRQKPQDLAIKPPVEAQQPAPPEPSAKIAERVQTTPPAPAAPASAPQATPSSSARRGGASDLGARGAELSRPIRRACAVGRAGGDVDRFGGQPAKTGRELGLDRVVPDSAGAEPAGDGRGKGGSGHPRSQDARDHDLEEEHRSDATGDAHDRPEILLRRRRSDHRLQGRRPAADAQGGFRPRPKR